jgi:hypothetical protein
MGVSAGLVVKLVVRSLNRGIMEAYYFFLNKKIIQVSPHQPRLDWQMWFAALSYDWQAWLPSSLRPHTLVLVA